MNEILKQIIAAADALPEGQTDATFDGNKGSMNIKDVVRDLRALDTFDIKKADGEACCARFLTLLDMDQLGKMMGLVVQHKPEVDFRVGDLTLKLSDVMNSILVFVEVKALT